MYKNTITKLAGSVVLAAALTTSVFAAEPAKKVLDKAVKIQASSDQQGRASQQKIDTFADKTDSDLRDYKAVLKQVENMKIYNQQMRDLIVSQNKEMVSIKEKMKNVSNLKKEVLPLVSKMAETIKTFVSLDVPFLKEERTKRMADLDLMMNRADVSTSEKFRRILEAYQIENEYGRTIESYNGDVVSPSGDKLSVEFLRVGRLALMYRGLDGHSYGRWDKSSSKFVELERSYRGALKDGLRVAKKQKAPNLLTIPVVKSQGGASETTKKSSEG